ncbi:MAG: hypothetical protein FJW38_17790 [Acidobacteria bacterium]|nr:hypothetical protein [Acidobacteriota bacterium]
MRNVVVDYIRAKTANRRAGDWQKITLECNSADAAGALAFRLDEVLDLDAALDELAQQDERKARVVEMRFFGGMEFEEVAEILEVSVITVKRDWSFAKAWLGTRLKP